jgi:glycosyltransferase involved in cell wall biosynthesis
VGSVPLVSVVTPFHNTREFLAECIESVLRQRYQNWEYVLVDNRSNDGSSEVALSYASRFPEKIRLIRTESFLSQVQNYNFALSCIGPNSKYCKIVQADDWIYAECLDLMVALAESDDSIGIVSSYRLKGSSLLGEALPHHKTVVSGAEICRLQLTTSLFAFGTPTTTLYRSEIVRNSSPFYDERTLHDDTDACYRTLRNWKFGFVHQVLSFSRVENDSIMSRVRDFHWWYLDKYLQLCKFGPVYLEGDELAGVLHDGKRQYYSFLAHRLLSGGSRAFWRYHISGLRTGGQQLEKTTLLKYACLELLRLLVNPGQTVVQLYDGFYRRSRKAPRYPIATVIPPDAFKEATAVNQRPSRKGFTPNT